MKKTALIRTTAASEADCSGFQEVEAIVVTATEPAGTKVRFVTKAGNNSNWQKYDTDTSAWKDVATQDITGESVISEGNTKEELETLGSAALSGFTGKKINFAAGLQMESGGSSPTLTGITVSGKTGSRQTEMNMVSDVIPLTETGSPVSILTIDVDKTESLGGTVAVLASIKTDANTWTDYTNFENYITAPATTALAIRFKANFKVTNPGTSVAKLNSVTVKHRTDSISTFSEGTGVCVTKTYNFDYTVGRAHLMVKHPMVPDTEFTAEIALRPAPIPVVGETLGKGTGEQQTVTLAHTEGLASHDFKLYFGEEVQTAGYSFSPNTGNVTFVAPLGAIISADYTYGWSKETFVPMTHDSQYADKYDNALVDDQFDYIAGADDPKGTVGTLQVSITQKQGVVENELLGKGTGVLQSFRLPHHAKPETIVVAANGAEWLYREVTDTLLITAPIGEEIRISYEWAARTNYIESIVAIFNE